MEDAGEGVHNDRPGRYGFSPPGRVPRDPDSPAIRRAGQAAPVSGRRAREGGHQRRGSPGGGLATVPRKPVHAQNGAQIHPAADPYQPRAGNRYVLYGSLAGLDSPGEWFLDEPTGVVYLWPPDGSSPGRHVVEVRQRDYACDLRNRAFIEIQGIDILGAAVTMDAAHDCLLDDCHLRYVEHYRQFGLERTPPVLNVVTGKNKAPDLGAYEFGGPRWKAGADWRDPDLAPAPAKNLQYAPCPAITEHTMIRQGLVLWLDANDPATLEALTRYLQAKWGVKD